MAFPNSINSGVHGGHFVAPFGLRFGPTALAEAALVAAGLPHQVAHVTLIENANVQD
jgi:hypothetical protein